MIFLSSCESNFIVSLFSVTSLEVAVSLSGHNVFPRLLPAAAVVHSAGSAGPISFGSVQTSHREHRLG